MRKDRKDHPEKLQAYRKKNKDHIDTQKRAYRKTKKYRDYRKKDYRKNKESRLRYFYERMSNEFDVDLDTGKEQVFTRLILYGWRPDEITQLYDEMLIIEGKEFTDKFFGPAVLKYKQTERETGRRPFRKPKQIEKPEVETPIIAVIPRNTVTCPHCNSINHYLFEWEPDILECYICDGHLFIGGDHHGEKAT